VTRSSGSRALRKETDVVQGHYERRQKEFTALRKETDVVHGTTKRRQMWFTTRLKKGVTCCDAQLWFKGTALWGRFADG